jgi:hypothetical protein
MRVFKEGLMGISNVTRVTRDIEGMDDTIAPEKLLSGNGQTKIWNAFSDASGQFHVGHWASGPCKIKVSYTEDEYCVLLSGKAELTDADGNSEEYGPNQPFVTRTCFVRQSAT